MDVKQRLMMAMRVQVRVMLISYAVAAAVLLALFGFLSCQRRANSPDTIQEKRSMDQLKQMQWKNKFNQELWDIQKRR